MIGVAQRSMPHLGIIMLEPFKAIFGGKTIFESYSPE